MKKTALCLTVALAVVAPAHAQFGTIGKIRDTANKAMKIADMHISDKDERAIGDAVSKNLVDFLGVHQDAQVTKYVTLVGTVLAKESTRPDLDWRFIVLDTDGVNAYAAPGGLVHITRGALALIKSEAELAGVLGHEIGHITSKHSIHSIQRSKGLSLASDEVGAQGGFAAGAIGKLAQVGTEVLLFNEFNRDQELESDKIGLQLANKVGYSPAGLTTFLNRLAERNKDRKEKNGLFATHPQLKERLEKNDKTAKEGKLTAVAMVEPRYASTVKVQAKDIAAIVMVPYGARGAAAEPAASTQASNKEEKKEEPKKRGFGLGGLGGALTQSKQQESTQASASAGGRMMGPDNNAAGGSNRTPVRVTLTPAEIAEFKKGIA